MANDNLKLENQICFPVYAASRLIIKEYSPLLNKLSITYPQYLVLLILWENDNLPVNDIAKKLILNTNTITPLLKRMEQMELIAKKRSSSDERKVLISLTTKGIELQHQADTIPTKLAAKISESDISLEELIGVKNVLNKLIDALK